MLAVLLAGFGVSAAAADTQAPSRGEPRQRLRLCYNDQLGTRDGGHFSMVLMRAVEARMPGLEIDYVAVPWMRCLLRTSRGEFDGIVGASHTPERALDLAYPRRADGTADESRRMFSQGYRLLRRRGSALGWDGRGFVHIEGAIGVERGHSSVSFARGLGATVDEQHPDVGAMLAKLRAGRLDGALIAEPQLPMLVGSPGMLEGLEIVDPPLAPRAYYLAMSRVFQSRYPGVTERLWDAVAVARRQPDVQRAMREQQGRSASR